MKRKEPTQSERLMRALLRGAKVDRPYALNKLGIAHPGARVRELREEYFNDTWHTTLNARPIRTVKAEGRSYYWIAPKHRPTVAAWWKERSK